MGKTYIDTVKYVVYADVEIDGLVEKPDVVGAIFGQTEGLLGDELDLRDLQKNGRIGRIEVDLQPRGGKSKGKIKLPSSLDMVETSILAASLETVDRVGPCEARIGVEKIEDTRSVKRKDLVERAKKLLKTMITEELPESKEISEQVRQEVKVSEISEYGAEKLPCGPGIEKFDSIIIVEGRADVLNLLKNDVTNVVAIGGANVTNAIAELAKKKEVTVFLDGDRGGDIILRELANVAEIDFVARAPRGKEVEELARKELIKCLRAKVPFEQGAENKDENGERRDAPRRDFGYRSDRSGASQYERREPQSSAPTSYEGRRESQGTGASNEQSSSSYGREQGTGSYGGRQSGPSSYEGRRDSYSGRQPYRRREYEPSPMGIQPPSAAQASSSPIEPQAEPRAPVVEEVRQAVVSEKPQALEMPEAYKKSLDELENTLRARFYNDGGECVKEIPVRDIIKNLEEEKGVSGVVFDGIITQRLADMAENKGVKFLAGVKMGNVFRKPTKTLVYTKA